MNQPVLVAAAEMLQVLARQLRPDDGIYGAGPKIGDRALMAELAHPLAQERVFRQQPVDDHIKIAALAQSRQLDQQAG